MSDNMPQITNIAIVGGNEFCKEILEKTTMDYGEKDVNARFSAVVDEDPSSPGILLAKKLNLKTLKDYHELYNPEHSIHLIIILTPESEIFDKILNSRPPHIRILSYHVFKIFWNAIGLEERKLRERTIEIETILNGIQDYILVITPDKKIVDVNDSFLKMIGYSRDRLLGRKCYEIFTEISNDQYEICDTKCPMNKVINDRRPAQLVLNQVDNKGQPRYIEVTMHPLWEEDGRISKFIEISRDITVRLKEEEEITKRLEQMVEERTMQLKETHNKLLHQDKMASLGKLSASVVHEINNPIAGILNLIILIKRILSEGPLQGEDLENFKQYLDLMEKETRRTSNIISNLLAFSRQSKMELGRIDLNQIIEQTLILNSNLLKINNIKVERELDPNLPDFIGSADQLQQVFMNFISNAVEAMEGRKNCILRITTMHSLKDDKYIIRFKDTGSGVPRENISNIFEPFFTTKKGKGVGLGLSVAYGIIQEHGGSIDVRTISGKGTTFEIELPAAHKNISMKRTGGLDA